MLLFRFPEAMLVKLASPFMLDSASNGGLGLNTAEVGFVYGTIGIIGLTLGGIIGGVAVSHGGLTKWLWPRVLSISLPDAVYIYLSYFQDASMLMINLCVFIEQFGYGFGFTAYMLYLIYFSRGERSTSVYAICTGLMALGMMLPGMMAGWMEEKVGYQMFFVIVMACTSITAIVSALLKIDPEFGKKEKN
jgi:PAT family beta-lactamase induction signal transducer AmpG